MYNKRGQFFLVAAFIIVGLVVSLATAVNTIKVGNSNEAFYDLADEVGFETKRVLDYGVFNQTQDINNLMENFLTTYVNYIGQEEVVFIYGNLSHIEVLVFEAQVVGSIGIITGGGEITQQIQDIVGGEQAIIEHDTDENKVTVEINGIEYIFNLREGQNFFFVIIKDENDERFVATG